MTDREQFEAWMKEQGCSDANLERWIRNTDQYSSQISQAAWEGWRAAAQLSASKPAEQERWRLVPTELTEKMIRAWFDTDPAEVTMGDSKDHFQPRYAAMLAASPAAPSDAQHFTQQARDAAARLAQIQSDVPSDAQDERGALTKQRIAEIVAEFYEAGDGDTEHAYLDVDGLTEALHRAALPSTDAAAQGQSMPTLGDIERGCVQTAIDSVLHSQPPGWPVVVNTLKDILAAPAQSGEPVAIVESWTNGSYHRNYRLKWLKDVPEGTNLYAAHLPQSDGERKDAERWRWLAPRFVGADFDWNEQGVKVLCFEIDREFRVSRDVGASIDATLAKQQAQEGAPT